MTGDSCFVTGDIDNLSYTYASNTNQLSTVTESASMTWGFKNPTSNTTPYEYDDNGSMTEDHYKGVVTVYNHLTLPVVISNGTDSILMTYDAGGSLLRKQHKTGSTVVMTRDYIGGIEYVNDTLDAIYHSEGRIKYIDEVGRYEYYIRDHLGNIRITYSDLNADGLITTPDEIVEEMHYYPYGMMMEGPWMGSSGQFGYNGIEYESFLDLEMNLATYRGLDPALGRWWQVDPEAESLYSMSPYQAMGNNPILYSDPDGDFIPLLVAGAAIIGAGHNVYSNWDKILQNPRSAIGYVASGAVGGGVSVANPALGRIITGAGNVVTDISSGNLPKFDSFGDVAGYAAGTTLDAIAVGGSGKLAKMGVKGLSDLGVDFATDILLDNPEYFLESALIYTGEVIDGVASAVETFRPVPFGKMAAQSAPGMISTAISGTTSLGADANRGFGPKHGGQLHNERIDNWVKKLHDDPSVSEIRKNQWQVDYDGNTVGRNRPDLQFNKDGKHFNLEWDTSANSSKRHKKIVTRNDRKAISKFWKLFK